MIRRFIFNCLLAATVVAVLIGVGVSLGRSSSSDYRDSSLGTITDSTRRVIAKCSQWIEANHQNISRGSDPAQGSIVEEPSSGSVDFETVGSHTPTSAIEQPEEVSEISSLGEETPLDEPGRYPQDTSANDSTIHHSQPEIREEPSLDEIRRQYRRTQQKLFTAIDILEKRNNEPN